MSSIATLILALGMFMADQPAPPAPSQPTVTAETPAGKQEAVKVTPKNPYDDTEGQIQGNRMMRLSRETADFATTAKQELADKQAKTAASKDAFDKWAKKICTQNGWDTKEYKYDIDTRTWYHILPAGQTKADKSPATK